MIAAPSATILERLLGTPVRLSELKHRPGRRTTLRAAGPRGSAIVKLYASERAPVVGERLRALAGGPPEPLVPEVLALEAGRRMLVLSELPGSPLRTALLARDARACVRAGTALAAWHRHWRGSRPDVLARHTAERELALLERRARAARPAIAERILALAPALAAPWACTTIVHRDLYEEQLLLGARVGLIDLDDAALGPPELDLGNLWAHLDLLGLRTRRSLAPAASAILEAYSPDPLDGALLERCRLLARLRLACIHDEPGLLDEP